MRNIIIDRINQMVGRQPGRYADFDYYSLTSEQRAGFYNKKKAEQKRLLSTVKNKSLVDLDDPTLAALFEYIVRRYYTQM
jgi:hypothetical protein